MSRCWSRARRRLVVVAIAALACGLRLPAAQTADRPNVVVFISDDVSWNDHGCYGNAAARTPQIDALARGGLRFTQAYLTASSCSPSRSSIITSRYPHNLARAAELHEPMPAHLPWLPELLRGAGYHTALVGKNHMSRQKPAAGETARPEAWDVVDNGNAPGNRGGHAGWTRAARERPAGKPFFLWLAATDAHREWNADDEWDAARYGAKHRPEDVVVPPYLVDDAPTRRDLASYYNEVTRFDWHVGAVVAALREEGVLDDTLIFVLSDNGRPFPRAKTRLHDSGMKTALVAHWPRGIRSPGAAPAGLASAIDLAPTILEACKVPIPATFQGVSLLPVFADPAAVARRYAFSEHNWHDYEAHGRAVRDAGYLYIRNARPDKAWEGPADSVRSPSHRSLQARRDAGALTPAQADVFLAPRPRVELYRTADDPAQLRNLAGDPAHAEAEKRLAALLDRWIDETGDAAPESLSRDAFDRETGRPLEDRDFRGTPPGAPRGADRIDRPGPR